MCATCGCGDPAGVRLDGVGLQRADDEHHHEAGHGHGHRGGHGPAHGGADGDLHRQGGEVLTLEQRVLAKNDALAETNRRRLAERSVLALNLMSSPGSGKTTLLERTIRLLPGDRAVAVVEGDQETALDAERIRATGCAVVQVNTGAGCHLDAEMLAHALDVLDPEQGSVLFVENVGNLVCPALFDLGESARVVVVSVTEGQDKPLKYPHMFAAADLVLINKVDLLPYVQFDVDVCAAHARAVRPGVKVLALSATCGTGMDAWLDWVLRR